MEHLVRKRDCDNDRDIDRSKERARAREKYTNKEHVVANRSKKTGRETSISVVKFTSKTTAKRHSEKVTTNCQGQN